MDTTSAIDGIGLDPRPVGEVLRSWARATPDAVALLWSDRGRVDELSYAQLCARAEDLGTRLLSTVGLGGTVAVAAATSADWLVAEYAASLAGMPLVPINPAFTDGEIQFIVEVSGASLVLCDAEFRGEPLLSRVRSLKLPRPVRVDELACWRDLPRTSVELPEVDPASGFLIQFTSGTTGRPKGAVLSHRAAYNCAALSMTRLGGTRDDRWLNVMPMHHVGGSVSVTLAVLSVGASMAILPAFEPGRALELLSTTRSTILGAVPTMQMAMLEHPAFRSTDLSALRIVQSGGSVVPAALIRTVESAFGVEVMNAYGQSESPNATMTSPGDPDEIKAETIGRPLPHREVRIVTSDGKDASSGERGELWMRSPLVMNGYVGVDPALASETLDSDGWLHTGDVCSADDQGVIRIHGRIRDVIIRGGENIYPAEVEAVMIRHPEVLDCAVVGTADDRWGEVPVAIVRVRPGFDPTDEGLEAHARADLASFKVPRRWVRADDLPLTASGKVKKHELRSRLGL